MAVTASPVLVTGATGFIAAEIVKQLLTAGYSVRGTTRNVAKAKEQGELTNLEGAGERLELVEADLNHAGAFSPLMADCEYVIHTASPYVLDVADPQRDLVDPAVEGTLSVLISATDTPSVKRVVLTSSFAAIASGPRDQPYDETHWNNSSSLASGPYAFSKTQAERKAWDFMESEDRHFDLVVINPTGVIGPSIVSRVNQTHQFFVNASNGQMPGIIDLNFPMVDVRDVAKAHILAMENPGANGRYLTSADTQSLRRMIENIEQTGLGDKYKLPRLSLDNPFGTLLVKAFLFTQPKGIREFLSANLAGDYHLDTSKIENDLGMTWRDLDQSVQDAALDLDQWGHLGKK